jgi:phospholipid/cholesterol/gamma-HCH transport system substrate-binding protein
MSSDRRQAVLVGLFVTLVAAILAGAVLTIGDLNATFTRKIGISVVFDDVGGLKAGDNVWFSGLKIGTVRRLEFHGGSEVEVDLAIDREAAAYIPADATAHIGSDGLIGNRIVVIADGTAGGPLVEDGAQLVAIASVSTDDMKEMLQQNNENLLAITADLRALTSKMASGEGTVGRLLGDEEMYPKLQSTVSSLETASASAQDLTAQLALFSQKLNKEGSLPNDLATDKELYASLTASVNDLKAVTERANVLVARLDESAKNPNTAAGALLSDDQAAADLKETLSNLSEGSKLLNEDLEAMQHNLLLRGYFKKKEKEEAKNPPPPPKPAAPKPAAPTPAAPTPAAPKPAAPKSPSPRPEPPT